MALSEDAQAILKTVVEYGSWGVYATGIVACAELIKAGYAIADDDYEGPRLLRTEKGLRAGLKRGWMPR